MKQTITVLAMVLLSAAAADAQTCAGGTELGRGAHRVVVGGQMADGINGAGASYGYGSNRFFGTAGFGVNHLDAVDANQKTVSTLFGSQFGGGLSPVSVCPVGQADWGFGPNVAPVSVYSFSLSGGGRIGIETGSPERFNVVPTAGLSIVRSGMWATNDLILTEANFWDTYSVASVGVGLRFNRSRMAVVPSVAFPMGLEGADPSFGVTFASNF